MNTREENAAELKAENEITKVLGHEFRPMTRTDWDCFSGADDGTKICYLDDVLTLLLTPRGTIIAVDDEGDETEWQTIADRAR